MKSLQLKRDTLSVPSTAKLFKFVIKWKLLDILYIIVIVACDATVIRTMKPFERQFYINDMTLLHPYTETETVSIKKVMLIGVLAPLVLFGLVSYIFSPVGYKNYLWYVSLVGFVVTIATCDLFVSVVKNWIGRCRPDFLARCIPSSSAVDNVLYTSSICTTTDTDRLQEGFRSTPSGHSSFSFSAFGFTTMWLFGQLVALSNKYVGSWRFALSALPTFFAVYIALSRSRDYRHHFVDIFLGSLIGWLFAWWGYRRCFPSVFAKECYVPNVVLQNSEKGSDTAFTSDDYYADTGLVERAPAPPDLEAARQSTTMYSR